ncbi:MAG: bile acid:sodium symporter family protein [Cyanobacteria bacterium J06638_6]
MESNLLTEVFLPLSLFCIMLGMGLDLTPGDFKRIWLEPKRVLLGLAAQLILLPALGFLLTLLFPLQPELAVGVMILVACPGGPASNLFTYLAKGDIALSITLTAFSSVITLFTIPLIVNLSTQLFIQEAAALHLPFLKTVIQIAVITLIPVAIGMVLHSTTPRFAARVERKVKWLSVGFLGVVIAGIMLRERANLSSFFLQAGAIAVTLILLAMTLGYAIAKLAKLDQRSVTAITIEVGVQNGALAVVIATAPSFLNTPAMAIPSVIYSLLVIVISSMFTWWAAHTTSRNVHP